MPYKKEIASGDSLIWLENSEALREFKGVIRNKEELLSTPPPVIAVPRKNWWPRRVIAVDGSHITTRVNNGFPGAEAGLVMISVVAINLELLQKVDPGSIPSPSIFHDMEKAHIVDAPLPGIGIVRRDVDNDDPVNFFRETIWETLSHTLADNHETLLETLRAVSQGLNPKKCPINDCENPYTPGEGKYLCSCGKEYLFETDILRLHEYFDGVSTSGEAHGRLMSVLEILVLLNILRFFADKIPGYLKDCAFVLDGPLAVFGTPASILRPIKAELRRLNKAARDANGADIVLFGIQKTGAFVEHWEQIDWDEDIGPRTRHANGTVIAPDSEYIRQNIFPNKKGKNFGTDTHFGKIVMYKTHKGEHTVLTTAMLNEKSQNTDSNEVESYPRLGDILDVMDQMATHLYRGGFLPLVRAHAHAAIPLKRGSDIIKTLLET